MNNIINILKKELKEVFRDKKSLAMMLIIPIFIPLIIIGLSALFESEQQQAMDVTNYNKIGFNYELSNFELELATSMNIEVINKTDEELKKEYENGFINLYVIKQDNKYILNGNNDTTTNYAASLMESYYLTYKEYLQTNYLEDNKINSSEVINIVNIEKNIYEENEISNFTSNYIVNYAFLFILMAITISATYPATDATAGEKERGTLETLLTFPIKSKDIIIGKFLSVSLSSIITGLLSLILTIISLIMANDMFEIYNEVSLMLTTTQIIFAIIVILMYSLMISGLCIAIASKSKTFKEAQSALTPLTFISFFPGMIAFMIEIESSFILSMIPFLNYSILFTDITNGNVNIINIILMTISTIIIIILVLTLIIKQYKSEKVLFTN